MSEPEDVGAEDWEFPDASELTPAEVGALWAIIEDAAKETAARHNRLKERKAAIRELAITVIELSGQRGARVPGPNGRDYNLTLAGKEHFTIKDPAAFEPWAKEYLANGGDDIYDSTPRLRESVFRDLMRLMSQDGQPLPPGVIRYVEPGISRTLAPSRKVPLPAADEIRRDVEGPEFSK